MFRYAKLARRTYSAQKDKTLPVFFNGLLIGIAAGFTSAIVYFTDGLTIIISEREK